MNSNVSFSFFIMILLLVVPLNGCLDISNPILHNDTIIYESHPTSIQYTISYGYTVNVSGTGSSTVFCTEDLPELINGSISHQLITPTDNLQKIIAKNTMIKWNESTSGNNTYLFKVTAQIIAQEMLIQDLTGVSALIIEDINTLFPDIANQYCSSQGDDETIYIDPLDPEIHSIAYSIQNNMESSNAFLVAKQLFEWLKNNTIYKVHPLQERSQPASITLTKGQGDCDDLSFLYISLCRSIGLPARFIRGYLLNMSDSTFTAVEHMWVEVFVGGNIGKEGWIPVECAGVGETTSEVHQNFGVEDVFHLRLFTDDGSNESIAITSSHISVQYEPGLAIDVTGFAHIANYEEKRSQELCVKKNTIRSYA